jgi:hypothetical protein
MKLKIKKIPLATIILATVLAIGLILFVGAFSKKDAFSKFNLWGAKETVVDMQNKDSDNDGLLDWQEKLYGTDSLNPDTDSDGFLDGEEINSGNNPLVKGPNDKLVFHPLPIGDQYNITNKILSSDVIDTMLQSYIAQKNTYLDDHSEIASLDNFTAQTEKSTIQEMMQRSIGDAYPILIEKAEQTLTQLPEIFDIKISDGDMKISEDNGLESINTYISQTSSFLKSDTFFLQQKSLSAVTTAFKDGDFSQIDSIIRSNDEKLNELKEIIVPSSWKEIHKEGLALTFLIRNIFVSFRDIQNDPFKAYVALQRLEKFPNQWNAFIEEAINLAKQQDIKIPL